MAVPLLTGPGAITIGIMLYNGAATAGEKAALSFITALVFVISYVVLRRMNSVYGLLGKTGTKVVGRLMGLILSAIAVQFIIAGVREAFPTLI